MAPIQQSKDLKQILEREGFALYEIPHDRPANFAELQGRGPAWEYKIGSRYFLLPIVRLSELLVTKIIDTPRPTFRGTRLDWLAIFVFSENGLIIKRPNVGNITVAYPSLVDEFGAGFRAQKVPIK